MSIVEDLIDMFESIPEAVGHVIEDPLGTLADLFEGASEEVVRVVKVLGGSPECALVVGSPNFWLLVRHLVVARAGGLISNQSNCEAAREQVIKAVPQADIPGSAQFWSCACKLALSDVGDSVAAATTAGEMAVKQLALSREDQITGVIGGVSWGPKRLDLLIRDANDCVGHRCSNDGGKTWYPEHDWAPLGGQIQQPPVVTSWGWGRLDMFVCGSDRGLWHKCYTDGGWFPSELGWSPLGGQLRGGPAVATWGPGTLHVLVRGLDNALYYKGYTDRDGWTGWAPLGGQITGTPRVVAWAPGRLDVVARGSDGAVWHRSYDKRFEKWSEWGSLGGQFIGSPSIASWTRGRLDIIGRGTDNAIWHKCYTEADQNWYPALTEWSSLGGDTRGTPSIIARRSGHLDIVARGSDNAVRHKSYVEGPGWYPSLTEWASLGGDTSGSPTLIDGGQGRFHLVARGGKGGVWHKQFIPPDILIAHFGGSDPKQRASDYAKRWQPSLTKWTPFGGHSK